MKSFLNLKHLFFEPSQPTGCNAHPKRATCRSAVLKSGEQSTQNAIPCCSRDAWELFVDNYYKNDNAVIFRLDATGKSKWTSFFLHHWLCNVSIFSKAQAFSLDFYLLFAGLGLSRVQEPFSHCGLSRTFKPYASFCGPALNKLTRGLSYSLINVIAQVSQKCFQIENEQLEYILCVFEENVMNFLFFCICGRKSVLNIEKEIYIFALA